MDTFNVIILPRAEQDFEDLFSWLEQLSPSGAQRWAEAFHQALLSLELQPESHSLAPENEHHPEEIRQLLFRTKRGRTYRALFTIRGDEVFLLHVRGPGQDVLSPEDLELP